MTYSAHSSFDSQVVHTHVQKKKVCLFFLPKLFIICIFANLESTE